MKDVLEYAVSGLIGGLALGLGIVVIRDLISDRLRRRDDFAAALGAPVRLSTGPLKASRLPGGPSGADRERDLRRVAGYLRNAVPRKQRGGATLAVIPVDNISEIAPAVVAFIESCAKDGAQVVFADLTKGAVFAQHARRAAALASARSGSAARRWSSRFPTPTMSCPPGPMRSSSAVTAQQFAPPSDSLLSACRQADLLITVAELDPALGGDHLATWATDAVALFTGGRTHGGRAYAVGEMLRLAGLHVTGVLIGADKTDESLGYPRRTRPAWSGAAWCRTAPPLIAARRAAGPTPGFRRSPVSECTASSSTGRLSESAASVRAPCRRGKFRRPRAAGGSGTTSQPRRRSPAPHPTFTSKSIELQQAPRQLGDSPASGGAGGGQPNGGPYGRSYGGTSTAAVPTGRGMYGDGHPGTPQR